MPFHTEHHLYPSIPFHRLPRAHDQLRQNLGAPGPQLRGGESRSSPRVGRFPPAAGRRLVDSEHVAHGNLRTRGLPSADRPDARAAQLVYQTYGRAERDEVERDLVSHVVRRPAFGHRLARRAGADSRFDAVFHHHRQHVRQRTVDVAQHARRAARRRASLFTHVDNVTAQRRLLEDVFGIERLALAYGWSMGAQQALHWGALYPERVERIAAVCGSAKTSPHNLVFLEGIRAALTADPAWDGRAIHGPARARAASHGTRVRRVRPCRRRSTARSCFSGSATSRSKTFSCRDWEASFLRRDAAQPVVDDRNLAAIRHQRQ